MKDIAETIKVFIRRRPDGSPTSSNPESSRGGGSGITAIAADLRSCDYVSAASRTRQSFSAHRFFPIDCCQEDVFNEAAKDVTESVLQGYAGSVLAYGPTGSGKTHTMRGDNSNKGVIPRCIQHLLECKAADVEVWASYVQIYCEAITDLLPADGNPLTSTSNQLQIREKSDGSGVYLDGVSKYPISSEEEVLALLSRGDDNRATAATNANETSSRSHAVLLLSVVIPDESNAGSCREGRLVLVDLAGSERSSASEGRVYMRAEEAKSINLSLSALGNVMQALAERRAHVPYRDSKLTRLLQHSLGANARTAVIVTVHNEMAQGDEHGEVLNALRFAQRAMQVQVLAKVAPTVFNYEALYHATLLKLQTVETAPAVSNKNDEVLKEKDAQLALQADQLTSLQAQLQALQAENKAMLISQMSRSKAADTSNSMSSDGNNAVYWQEQVHSLRVQHTQEVQRLQQMRQQDLLKARQAHQDTQAELASLQSTLCSEREQLLRAMQDLRGLTERTAQQESYYKGRLSDLLVEVSTLQNASEDYKCQLQGMRQENKLLSNELVQLKADMLHMVSKERVVEMENLFIETVERLTNRVKNLEQPGAPASSAAPKADSSYAQAYATLNQANGQQARKAGLPPVPTNRDRANSGDGIGSGLGITASTGVRLEPGGRIRPAAAGTSSGSGKASVPSLAHSSSTNI